MLTKTEDFQAYHLLGRSYLKFRDHHGISLELTPQEVIAQSPQFTEAITAYMEGYSLTHRVADQLLAINCPEYAIEVSEALAEYQAIRDLLKPDFTPEQAEYIKGASANDCYQIFLTLIVARVVKALTIAAETGIEESR